jgi:hypothetical protein
MVARGPEEAKRALPLENFAGIKNGSKRKVESCDCEFWQRGAHAGVFVQRVRNRLKRGELNFPLVQRMRKNEAKESELSLSQTQIG